MMIFDKDGRPAGEMNIPVTITQAAAQLKVWLAANQIESLMGLGDVSAIQRQSDENGRLCDEAQDQLEAVARKRMAELAEVTRERDALKAMVDLHDALNDRRREKANQTPFKRRKYENG